jgi:hypothetical protein
MDEFTKTKKTKLESISPVFNVKKTRCMKNHDVCKDDLHVNS